MEEVRCRLASQESARTFLSLIWEMEEHMQLRVVTLLWQWWLERNRVPEGERRQSTFRAGPCLVCLEKALTTNQRY